MRPLSNPVVVLTLALGCTAPHAEAGAPVRAPQEAAPAPPAPIAFGDDEHAYRLPFFPGAQYDARIPTPEALVTQPDGLPHASRLSHHAEILACFRAWAAASPRMTLATYGRTFEGRELVYAVVTSPANHARLDDIRAGLGRLHDPRGASEPELERIVEESPACAWMGYSIHGDELSGSDAAIALGYHLVASTDAAVDELLQQLVIVIDPVMNPDGRERIVSMTEQAASLTQNLDYASMHRGRWPYGRGNHYLFDMNRDWMAGTQPETQGRWRTARSFFPQLFVDAHEMWSLDTFLFYPQSRPLNPELPPSLPEWQRRYAEDAAKAFDRHGWSYYTREWADAWGPFYSDAWGSLLGATGMLYEQARTLGTPLRRRSGEILTYRESVHHQVAASLANLQTLAAHREDALRAYLGTQRRNVAADTDGNDRMLVIPPAANVDRWRELARILLGQGIETTVAADSFEARNALDARGTTTARKTFPEGSLVVQARQPMRPMVRSYLTFDQRLPLEDLQEERKDLEQKNESRLYDVTSWSLPLALDLEAYWVDERAVEGSALALRPKETRFVGHVDSPTAWAASGASDASVAFAVRAMELGLQVNISDKAFRPHAGAPALPRGSLLIRRVENGGQVDAIEEKLATAARRAGLARVHRLATGLSPGEGPDLGGGHFELLARPRVALLANAPVTVDRYGHLWHHIDQRIGLPITQLDAQAFGRYDLRRYNVLVLPPHGGGLAAILEDNKEELEAWVRNGGTLIACGNAAAALTSGALGLSKVVLRRDALDDVGPYERAARREWSAHDVEVSEDDVWGASPADEDAVDGGDAAGEDLYAEQKIAKEHDTWLRRFSPTGVTLRGRLDPVAWINYGAEDELPVFHAGSHAFLSRSPVQTAVRLDDEDRLRLGGLVWPEARERLATTAWLTVESVGNGQVILFAGVPAFRGYHLATGRLLSNAIVYGPGLGASQPDVW